MTTKDDLDIELGPSARRDANEYLISEFNAVITQLKPCPFCGGEGKIFGAIHGHDEADVFVAGCKSKDCIDGPLHGTYAEAAEWWNTRYEPVTND